MKRVDVKAVIRKLSGEQSRLTPGEVAREAEVTRQTAHRHLSTMVELGELARKGQGRSTHYVRLGAEPAPDGGWEAFVDDRAGLEEDEVWKRVSKAQALVGLKDPALETAHYALTELVNNAIEHSSARSISIRVGRGLDPVRIEVKDDGVGIFRHVCAGLGLASPLEAVQELHKGKTTTMPDRHTGEGLFFVSKAVERFEVESDDLRWIVDNERHDMAIESMTDVERGTLVRLTLRRASGITLRSVFDEYTDDHEFSRTRAIVRLFAMGVRFISRSEAKRLTHGLDRFREVVLDFDRVRGVGQGFADEVFRVWAKAHPEVRLTPINMCEPVEFMVRRAGV